MFPSKPSARARSEDLIQRGIAPDMIRVIFNGVDIETLTPGKNTRSESPLFVYLGRLKRYKRVDIVIRAFALLGRPDARAQKLLEKGTIVTGSNSWCLTCISTIVYVF